MCPKSVITFEILLVCCSSFFSKLLSIQLFTHKWVEVAWLLSTNPKCAIYMVCYYKVGILKCHPSVFMNLDIFFSFLNPLIFVVCTFCFVAANWSTKVCGLDLASFWPFPVKHNREFCLKYFHASVHYHCDGVPVKLPVI